MPQTCPNHVPKHYLDYFKAQAGSNTKLFQIESGTFHFLFCAEKEQYKNYICSKGQQIYTLSNSQVVSSKYMP